jgi:hypothetical protein
MRFMTYDHSAGRWRINWGKGASQTYPDWRIETANMEIANQLLVGATAWPDGGYALEVDPVSGTDCLYINGDTQSEGTITTDSITVASDCIASSGVKAGRSGNPSGTTAGHFYVHTTDDSYYLYDGGDWVGDLVSDGFGFNGGAMSANTYLRRFNGMITSATLGVVVPWNCKIVAVSCARGDTTTGAIEIRDDGVSAASLTMTGNLTAYNTYDADVAAGSVISCYWNSGSTIANPQVTFWYRRRN